MGNDKYFRNVQKIPQFNLQSKSELPTLLFTDNYNLDGANEFQREYIAYLEERNAELLSQLNHLKETYESRILAKDLNKHYLISAAEEMLNLCAAIPEEIDIFFDKMTAAMGVFKNILLRKSEMVQLVEKISKIINPTDNINNDLISVDDSGLVKEQMSEARVGRKAGTVKVSPMINGHIISTEPRIYLSRVPGVFTPACKNDAHQLTPIIEESPSTSSEPSDSGVHVLREVIIPVERINLNKMSFNYISEESPKSRFKGPKTWKKSLSSNKRLSDHQKNTVFLDNSENLNKKFSNGEVESPSFSENVDPMEGPSWLYKEISEMNSSPSRFIDYRRRKNRFATVFDKNEDSVNYFEETNVSSEKGSGKLSGSREDEDDERDLEECEKRTSNSSEDLIGESFTNGSVDSPKRRKYETSRSRTPSKGSESVTSVKDTTENDVIVKLEHRLSVKGIVTKKPKGRSLSVKKNCKRIKSEKKSTSPAVSTPETDGRKRRFAAPAFKLVEPNLKRKLRRD